ncbi:sulfurtransferase [Algoriphagus sp. CAU 1675]|uniref:sulfurtransferase n=1 Tax=Algoriphagus sp. CAU 1675 TaxID=3032597 RepID=UPI0023DBAD8D|nr:sulfurtransferase [Algoriphagus sp. CAU 1675]MDF2157483.1 sulfurtransferase [Algoriphagus sp. CAU 1675]
MNSPIISAEQLAAQIGQANLILVDARNTPDPKSTFSKGHLQGARFVDPNEDLANIKENLADGGRHPLPSVPDFCSVLGKLGITPESHVVIYDDQNGANSAARMWWMLKAFGHQQVQVLEGGIQAGITAGIPVESGTDSNEEAPSYPGKAWELGIASMEEVERISKDKDYLLIDVRSPERYRGEQEPIDLVAGHIPGAINIPLNSNMDANGKFQAPEEIAKKYTEVFGERSNEHIIVHCGSGVSACHTLLALDYAGLGIPKLYVGSWSEWSRNDKPIGKSV